MAAIDEALKGNGLALSTFVVFSRAGHAIHEKEMETIKQSGLTAMQFGVLEALYNKGPLKICEVMEELLTTSGNITVVVKNLERDGLIRKEQDPKDGRACKLAITEEGKKTMERVLPAHYANIGAIFGALSDEEMRTLKEILKKFKERTYGTNDC